MTLIDTLGEQEYISLTTFKRNGTGVATPVWVMRGGEHLYVITEAESGKAKRLRNFSRVMVAPSDMRGKVTGASVDATAELLDNAGTEHVRELLMGKYGWKARAMSGMDFARSQWGRIRRQPAESTRVGIKITLSD